MSEVSRAFTHRPDPGVCNLVTEISMALSTDFRSPSVSWREGEPGTDRAGVRVGVRPGLEMGVSGGFQGRHPTLSVGDVSLPFGTAFTPLIIRSLVTLEGIALSVDPESRILGAPPIPTSPSADEDARPDLRAACARSPSTVTLPWQRAGEA